MSKPNVIICKTPRNDGMSNLLSMPEDRYQSAQFYIEFSKIPTIEDIVEFFEWMEFRGYHITNNRGWVYRSKNIANVVSEIYDYTMQTRDFSSHAIRLLTRSGGLRQRVIELLTQELDKTS